MWVLLKICLCLLATLEIAQGQSTRNICENRMDHTLVPSDDSCALYFECIENVAYLLSCPRGLYFSELTQSCDLPANVECDLTASTTTGPTVPGPIVSCENIPNFQYIPSPDSCSEYYQCIDGVAYLLSCPRGLNFSDLRQSCDLPSNANCPLTPPTTTETPSTTPSPPTTPDPSVSCINVTNLSFIASPTSCSLYYQCIGDVPFLVSCPRGLHFNELIQTCDLPANVNCEINSTPRPPPPSPDCENQPDNTFLPSPNSCSLYYQCIGDVGFLVSCPRGLYFNELIQTCDLPSNVDCSSTTEASTTPEIPTAPTVDAPSICRDLADGTLLPSNTFCERFYVCTNGNPTTMLCDGGLHFNPQTLICDDPANVNCQSPITPTTEPSTTTEMGSEGFCSNAANTTFVRNPIACGEFFQCINNEAHGRQCDGRLWFNLVQQRCAEPFETFCILSTSLCNGVDDERRIRSVSSCSDYIICSEGEPFPGFCNDHQWFDESRQVCDEIENVECDLDEFTESPLASECNGIRDFRLVRSRFIE